MRNVIIIGSGPAAYTAAIYSARANLKPLVITGLNFGGQLKLTSTVENFPGFPQGIGGKELMVKFHDQMEAAGGEYFVSDVKSVDFSARPFKIQCSTGESFEALSVIIATGSKAKWLNLPGEAELRSNGISTCATCDGAHYKDKKVVVAGGGDTAMEDALYLSRYAKSVVVLNRSVRYRASKVMLERVKNHDSIVLVPNRIPTKWLVDENGLKGIHITDPTNNNQEIIDCDGVFVAIGHEPSTKFLEGQIKLDINGNILLKEHTMTSVEGVFACGDVVDTRYRQAITAASQGCQAALDCEKWLRIII